MKRDEIICYFSGETGRAVKKIPESFFEEIREIRLRVNRPAAVSMSDSIRYITDDGNLTYKPEAAVKVSPEDIKRTFEAVCQYSVHSFQREISEGFVTVRGGHRVGICGTSVIQGNSIENVKNISSLNFRIAREITGCADELCRTVFGNGLRNMLLAGPPASGKTTMLRDIARILGKSYRVAIIDERGELAAVWNGFPQNDVGINTDVFDGYDKPTGIITALRVMSPQIIICDEIGSEKDLEAVREASRSGVYAAATIHASSADELEQKGISRNMFDSTVILAGDSAGKILSVEGTRKGAEKQYA